MSEPVIETPNLDQLFDEILSISAFEEAHIALYGGLSIREADDSILSPYEGDLIELRGRSSYQFLPESKTWHIKIEAPLVDNLPEVEEAPAPIPSRIKRSPSPHDRGLMYHNKIALMTIALQATSAYHNTREMYVALSKSRLNRAPDSPLIKKCIVKNHYSPLLCVYMALRPQTGSDCTLTKVMALSFMKLLKNDLLGSHLSDVQEIVTKRGQNLSYRRIFKRPASYFADGSPVEATSEA